MNLWIRSQDKATLIEVTQIYYTNHAKDCYHISTCDFEGSYTILAKYKTKQRALEVLNEINMFKDFFQFIELLPDNKKMERLRKVDFKNGDSLTYEMPQE